MADSIPAESPNAVAGTPGLAIDVERLRRDRLARCFAAMEHYGLDALVLGREANVRYVSDARRLWLAGPRPFGPGCVVVQASGAIHLLSTSSEGVPASIPVTHLQALTWNPENIVTWLASIPGLRDARCIGVDGWNAAAGRLLARAVPAARIADGDAALRAARSVKTVDEIACIRAAADVAAAALDAVVAALRPDVGEATLRAVFLAHIAARGVTIPSFELVAHPAVHAPLIALRCGVLRDGYEGVLIRTWPNATGATSPAIDAASRLCRALRDALVAACRPGAGARALLDVYARLGVPLPAFPIAHGSGLGCEPPLIGASHLCDSGWRAVAGTVLALHAFVPSSTGGGALTQDLVHVTANGPELLTPAPYGPLLSP